MASQSRDSVNVMQHPMPESPVPGHDAHRTYNVRELLALTGLTRWALHYHRKVGNMPPPLGYGRHARYTWEHVQIGQEIAQRRAMMKQPIGLQMEVVRGVREGR